MNLKIDLFYLFEMKKPLPCPTETKKGKGLAVTRLTGTFFSYRYILKNFKSVFTE